jgi:uncharacterized membrane protein YdjX (TVP38/TMEM64 family)
MTAGSSAEPNRAKGATFAIAAALAAVIAILFVVVRTDVSVPRDFDGVREFLAALAPYRSAWYALPFVALAYVAGGFVLVPIPLLVAATGVVFGPWLGPFYALSASLIAASVGFAIGRATGYERVHALGGSRVVRIHDALERNGTLAVFLMRKVPASFLLSNIVAGASRVRYRDFIIGTVLGLGASVIALAAFGYQVTEMFREPTTGRVLAGLAFLCIPLVLALVINHALKRGRAGVQGGHA